MLRQHVTSDGMLAEDALGRLWDAKIVPVQPETRRPGIADGKDEALSPDPFRRLPSTHHHVLRILSVDPHPEPGVGVGSDGQNQWTPTRWRHGILYVWGR